jgi:thymidylate synthase
MIVAPDVYGVWIQQLKFLLDRPIVTPRSLPCREALGLQLVIGDSYRNIIVDAQRKLNYKFMIAQWLVTQLGQEDKLLEQFNPRMSEYESDGRGGVYPSYGPRLLPQWTFVMKCFLDDPETRQAVASIWEAQQAFPFDGAVVNSLGKVERYVPCTLSLQFLLRDGALHTIVTMRSSDAWLGIPYDVYNFTMLANHLCGALRHVLHRDIKLGALQLNLGSSHLYQEHWETARSIVAAPVGRSATSKQLPSQLENPLWAEWKDVLETPNNSAAMLALIARGEQVEGQ